MDLRKKWYNDYQQNQPNKFNEELIYGLRKEDDMVQYLIDVCKALEAIPYIKYKGFSRKTNENEFKQLGYKNISDSRMDLVEFHFEINFKGETSKMKMPIFIPKWINNYFYIINGNKFYPIYQHVESSTYSTRESLILKSLLMPIIVKMKNGVKLIDIDGNEYQSRLYQLNLFDHKNNFLFYYFATMGFKDTIKFFGYEKNIKIIKLSNNKIKEKAIIFPINKQVGIAVGKNKFIRNKKFKYFVTSLLDVFNRKTPIDRINDINYWKVKLGSIFTKNSNNQLAKSETVILSFNRILDERTKKNLLINQEDKENIYCLIRWMINNFDSLMKKDNLSLLNKRVRLCEYIINQFVKRMSSSTYRILNSKTLTMNKIKGVLKPPSMIIVSDLQKSKLLRYNSNVNDLDLFNVALRWSNRGPSSLGESGKKTVSVVYRGINTSHFGRLSLNTVSSSDPGMSGCFSPFVKTDGWHYVKIK